MKVLIIDSHKGTKQSIPQNMHWQNAKILADYLKADLIWSYPTVNDNIKTGYDIIIFVHASHYSYTDTEWIIKNPDAKLFYITNEYNLGEPLMLWKLAKQGRKYTVIANHSPSASKVVLKYTEDWHTINLNCLIYNPKTEVKKPQLFDTHKNGCVYYGSYRKDRNLYFKKYLTENVKLSTHPKNVSKFQEVGISSNVCNRINWLGDGLFPFEQSLYIEDIKTHTNYNFLANRFYEALNYNCTPIFANECIGTVELSGYEIGEEYFIGNSNELKHKTHLKCKEEWHNKAMGEKENILEQIKQLL